jgi:hypothetical protein
MTVSQPEVSARRVQRFPNVTGQATVCLIHIDRNAAGSPTEIEVSPSRPSETCVFYPKRNDEPSSIFPVLEHPREVVWTVNGLRRGETIVIEAKPGIEAVFGRDPLTIDYPEQFVASGPVQAMLPMTALPRPYHWDYSITLRTGTSRLVLDPVIIVDEDP